MYVWEEGQGQADRGSAAGMTRPSSQFERLLNGKTLPHSLHNGRGLLSFFLSHILTTLKHSETKHWGSALPVTLHQQLATKLQCFSPQQIFALWEASTQSSEKGYHQIIKSKLSKYKRKSQNKAYMRLWVLCQDEDVIENPIPPKSWWSMVVLGA